MSRFLKFETAANPPPKGGKLDLFTNFFKKKPPVEIKDSIIKIDSVLSKEPIKKGKSAFIDILEKFGIGAGPVGIAVAAVKALGVHAEPFTNNIYIVGLIVNFILSLRGKNKALQQKIYNNPVLSGILEKLEEPFNIKLVIIPKGSPNVNTQNITITKIQDLLPYVKEFTVSTESNVQHLPPTDWNLANFVSGDTKYNNEIFRLHIPTERYDLINDAANKLSNDSNLIDIIKLGIPTAVIGATAVWYVKSAGGTEVPKGVDANPAAGPSGSVVPKDSPVRTRTQYNRQGPGQ